MTTQYSSSEPEPIQKMIDDIRQDIKETAERMYLDISRSRGQAHENFRYQNQSYSSSNNSLQRQDLLTRQEEIDRFLSKINESNKSFNPIDEPKFKSPEIRTVSSNYRWEETSIKPTTLTFQNKAPRRDTYSQDLEVTKEELDKLMAKVDIILSKSPERNRYDDSESYEVIRNNSQSGGSYNNLREDFSSLGFDTNRYSLDPNNQKTLPRFSVPATPFDETKPRPSAKSNREGGARDSVPRSSLNRSDYDSISEPRTRNIDEDYIKEYRSYPTNPFTSSGESKENDGHVGRFEEYRYGETVQRDSIKDSENKKKDYASPPQTHLPEKNNYYSFQPARANEDFSHIHHETLDSHALKPIHSYTSSPDPYARVNENDKVKNVNGDRHRFSPYKPAKSYFTSLEDDYDSIDLGHQSPIETVEPQKSSIQPVEPIEHWDKQEDIKEELVYIKDQKEPVYYSESNQGRSPPGKETLRRISEQIGEEDLEELYERIERQPYQEDKLIVDDKKQESYLPISQPSTTRNKVSLMTRGTEQVLVKPSGTNKRNDEVAMLVIEDGGKRDRRAKYSTKTETVVPTKPQYRHMGSQWKVMPKVEKAMF